MTRVLKENRNGTLAITASTTVKKINQPVILNIYAITVFVYVATSLLAYLSIFISGYERNAHRRGW